MALKDKVQDGESYFVVEIKSIRRILEFLNDRIPCLCFIDEVLRGTNTVERIAASSQVLLHLAGRRCICMAATHDNELTSILEAAFRNLHFQEKITDGGIEFEYRLHEGPATSRNAIRLLRLMGYDETIVDEAENRAARFMEQGNWSAVLAGDWKQST
jgi:DNA mismatch repair ATPase MutS